MLIDCKLKPQ
jgi:hypothetical protein